MLCVGIVIIIVKKNNISVIMNLKFLSASALHSQNYCAEQQTWIQVGSHFTFYGHLVYFVKDKSLVQIRNGESRNSIPTLLASFISGL